MEERRIRMYCGKCGTEIKKNAKFCPNCGSKLKETAAPSKPLSQRPSLWNLIAIPFIWIWHKILTMLKNPKSSIMVKVCAAGLAVMLIAVLIGSAPGGYNKKVLGEWYEEGSSMLEFTLYDDGTCTEANSIQKGTWSIVNKNQLHIASPWNVGRTRIFTIIRADSRKLILAQHYAGGPGTMEPVTYWHTPHQ